MGESCRRNRRRAPARRRRSPRASLTVTIVAPGDFPIILSRCDGWSIAAEAIDGSRTVAESGTMAEPMVRFTAVPTGTEAACGCTVMGGGVGVGVGFAVKLAEGTGAGEGEGDGEGGGV